MTGVTRIACVFLGLLAGTVYPVAAAALAQDPGKINEERIADRLAALYILDAVLGKKMQAVAIEHLAAAEELTLDERFAWGILDSSLGRPQPENVASALKLLKTWNEVVTADNVKAFAKFRARLMAAKTPDQHRTTIDFSIRWRAAMTPAKAAGVVKVLSMMEASGATAVNDSKAKVQELFRKVLADNPDFVTAYAKAEKVIASYKTEEQKRQRELVKETIFQAKKNK